MGGVHGKLGWLCSWWRHHHPSSTTRDLNQEGGAHDDDDDDDDDHLHATIPSHGPLVFHYASLTQGGYYPDSPDRTENQDNLCIAANLQGNPNLHLFGVFDGHGEFGAPCSAFVKDRLVRALADDPRLPEDPVGAYHAAFRRTNAELHDSAIDDTLSGTTAVAVLVSGDTLHVANVGDSRAVAGVWVDGGSVVARDLSRDQTPFRKDEYERVRSWDGARVLSVGQISGEKDPEVQVWDEDRDRGDPPRLWVRDGIYPGTAFTRSVGDSVAEGIGAIADPEVVSVKITPEHRFFVLASDGVFDFLSSQDVVSMVSRYDNLQDACLAVVKESYKRWQEQEGRVDDITIIIVRIENNQCYSGTSHHHTTDTLKKVFHYLRKGTVL